ncbi:UNVERIFIED_CONTAM: hypothetical protein Sradi_5257100 [Sesamum radiatum]|uniref:Uncharacterized protein n=1 Tax=Sesamum radiatum TaxID=300843 RepID=A0AAW2LP54_SESRA
MHSITGSPNARNAASHYLFSNESFRRAPIYRMRQVSSRRHSHCKPHSRNPGGGKNQGLPGFSFYTEHEASCTARMTRSCELKEAARESFRSDRVTT